MMCSSPYTVGSKCNTLLNDCKVARLHIHDREDDARKVNGVMIYLNATFNERNTKEKS